MVEYIERKAVSEAVKHAWAKGIEPLQYIEIIPSADVVEVVHGRILDNGNPICGRCSECGESVNRKQSYCPNCGVKMDGGEAHEAD